jgi:signal transduction histidine kinase
MTNKYKNRLKKLFSNFQLVEPEPCSHDEVSAPIIDPASLLSEITQPTASQAPLLMQLKEVIQPSHTPGNGSTHPKEDLQTSVDIFVGPAIYSPLQTGWEVYLDGINRREQGGYVYDRSVVKEGQVEHNIDVPGSLLDTAIKVGGEEIGSLLLESDQDRQWTAEDMELVDAVAQQVAQQIETLRLLDEAQNSRVKAEEAFHRLSRQNSNQSLPGEDLLGRLPKLLGWTESGSSMGFVYEKSEVKTVDRQNPLNMHPDTVSTTITVSGENLGQLLVDSGKPLSLDDLDLVEMVAQRLSRQVENLRLLDESRHFHNETEEAIRRLTYQSWQAYLSGAEKANLGFQYDRHKVSPLESPAELDGKVYPLKVREEIIGKLAVDSPAAQHQEVNKLVEVITERLSTHLEGLRLAEQREQALAETETLYGISSRLSTAQSLEDALASVSEAARGSNVRDSRLFFISLDERGQPEGLTLSAIWYPEDGAQLVPVNAHFLLHDYPVYWQVLQDPFNPLLVSDVEQDPRFDALARDLFVKSGARAAAILPLTISGRWVGVIFINWENPHLFVEQEERLYSSLARQAAVVVNNRLLLEQTRKRAQELQTVAQVSTAASTLLDPLELLQSVVDLTKSSFSLYHAQVYLFVEEEGLYQVAAASGEIGRQILNTRHYILPDSDSVIAKAGRERRVIMINDANNEPGFLPNPLLPELRAEMAIPMIVGDRLLGVFSVQSSTVNRFSREDARTYSTLSSQVAVALQNAELYAEQIATVERLRELDHLKSAFLANMSHELRTPLNSILGFGEVLLLGLDGPLNDTMINDVRLIEKNGKHLLSLINDVLDMAKIEAGKMNLSFERFFLRDLIEETIDITGSLAREKALYLQVDPASQDLLDLVADRVRLRQVLINVVANAVKFTESGGISILSRQRPEDRKVLISIRDTGLGIPKDKLDMIFESFSQVDTSTTRKAGGTGLGLPISRRLVEMHGGRLWAESTGNPGEGSIFYIELPYEASKG